MKTMAKTTEKLSFKKRSCRLKYKISRSLVTCVFALTSAWYFFLPCVEKFIIINWWLHFARAIFGALPRTIVIATDTWITQPVVKKGGLNRYNSWSHWVKVPSPATIEWCYYSGGFDITIPVAGLHYPYPCSTVCCSHTSHYLFLHHFTQPNRDSYYLLSFCDFFLSFHLLRVKFIISCSLVAMCYSRS